MAKLPILLRRENTLHYVVMLVRVMRTSLAAALAWWAGSPLSPHNYPYFAPLAAILVIQVTVVDSLSRALQRVVGVVIGVSMALLAAHLVGLNAEGIGLLVLFSLLVGTALHLSPAGVSQVAISALLVWIIGSHTARPYAYLRIIETVVGALIGLAVAVLLWLPLPLGNLQRTVRRGHWRLSQLHRQLSEGLRQGLSADQARTIWQGAVETSDIVNQAQTSCRLAEQSLKFNLFAKTQRSQINWLGQRTACLARLVSESRGLTRTLAESAVRRNVRSNILADYVLALAELLQSSADGIPDISRHMARQYNPAAFHDPSPFEAQGLSWVALGSILTDLRRMAQELTSNIRAQKD